MRWLIVGILIGAWLSVESARAQDATNASWKDLPAGKSAIVFLLDNEFARNGIAVSDQSGKTVNVAAAPDDLPLLRQYLVDPGEYEIVFKDIPTLRPFMLASLKAGGVAFIEVDFNKIKGIASITGVSPEKTVGFDDAFELLYKKGYANLIEATDVDPASRVLYVYSRNTEPPVPIPPPPGGQKPPTQN